MKKILLLSLFLFLSAERFEVSRSEMPNIPNVWIDKATKLMWQDDDDTKTTMLNWSDANTYCENLTLNGFADWRLPNIDTLNVLYFKKQNLQNTLSNFYWSSTTYSSVGNYGWGVSFGNGNSYYSGMSSNGYVRCVRPESFSPSALTISLDKLYQESLSKALDNLPKPPLQTELIKDEFEKQADFEKRVKHTQKANEIAMNAYKIAYQAYYPKAKHDAMQQTLEIYYGKPIVTNLAYDAENELMGAKVSFENKPEISHNILLKLPPLEAKLIKSKFDQFSPIAVFAQEGDEVRFEGVKLQYDKKIYIAQLTDQSVVAQTHVATIENIAPTMTQSPTDIKIGSTQTTTYDTSKLISRNDLDELLARAPHAKHDPKKYAFVIGLESYKYTDNIAFAKRSAEMFAKTANRVLGVPEQNTYKLINESATSSEIKNQLKLMLRNVKSGDTIYFYYNGHGVPAVDKENEPYILSTDMMPDFVGDEPNFAMKQIYKDLSDSKAGQIIAIVDSCFSGSTDGKSIQKGVAATRVKPKGIEFDKSKMVVLTAGKDTQYSNAYNQKAHRMFSYFVIEDLLKGEKDIKALYGDVYKNTKETTRANYGDMRIQEPTMEGNEKISF